MSGQLEVAIGLETAHPEVLARLNKRMTLDAFRRAADFLHRHDIALRVFVLLSPPFMPAGEAVEWACRSIDLAAECGATACSVIPTRGGNGAMEALGGEFVPPRLTELESVIEYGLSRRAGPSGPATYARLRRSVGRRAFLLVRVLTRARGAAGGDEPRAASHRPSRLHLYVAPSSRQTGNGWRMFQRDWCVEVFVRPFPGPGGPWRSVRRGWTQSAWFLVPCPALIPDSRFLIPRSQSGSVDCCRPSP